MSDVSQQSFPTRCFESRVRRRKEAKKSSMVVKWWLEGNGVSKSVFEDTGGSQLLNNTQMCCCPVRSIFPLALSLRNSPSGFSRTRNLKVTIVSSQRLESLQLSTATRPGLFTSKKQCQANGTVHEGNSSVMTRGEKNVPYSEGFVVLSPACHFLHCVRHVL